MLITRWQMSFGYKSEMHSTEKFMAGLMMFTNESDVNMKHSLFF